eukprot:2054545-Alexandrium_andersonii.AAC.1
MVLASVPRHPARAGLPLAAGPPGEEDDVGPAGHRPPVGEQAAAHRVLHDAARRLRLRARLRAPGGQVLLGRP